MELTEFFSDIKIPMTVVHVISVVFGMGAALMSDVLFNFYGKEKKLSRASLATLRFLSVAVWWGLLVIAISGVGLFLSDIAKYAHSIKFLSKMSILAVLVLNGYVLHAIVWKHVAKKGFLTNPKESLMRRLSFACGAISLISWVGVCALGVLDAVPFSYGTMMTGYGAIIVSGVALALIIESHVFESGKK
ncbi:MAG: hypothetical protein JWM20_776 [Patescibacteria group bacterium]|nr:hypothetical protein [Patescibacteria group bacterium]